VHPLLRPPLSKGLLQSDTHLFTSATLPTPNRPARAGLPGGCIAVSSMILSINPATICSQRRVNRVLPVRRCVCTLHRATSNAPCGNLARGSQPLVVPAQVPVAVRPGDGFLCLSAPAFSPRKETASVVRNRHLGGRLQRAARHRYLPSPLDVYPHFTHRVHRVARATRWPTTHYFACTCYTKGLVRGGIP
jgi:hypothetical protein